jgi:HlyD family secretion protein
MKRVIMIIVVVIVVLGLAGVGAAWYLRKDTAGSGFITADVKRGELQAVIGATGTVEPEEVVDVGAQVAGQLLEFGKDLDGKQVDYGSHVDENTLLAKIDSSLYDADLASAKASKESAEANVKKAEADVQQMQAKEAQALADWERAQKVGSNEALAQSTYDSYKYAYQTAQANTRVTQAQLTAAQKAVIQADAAVLRADRNVHYCTIKSPVKGTIISRRVNIGQTVVSSLNAPSLFLIGKDLAKVQVWAPVNEADIGNIQAGQDVTFNVDTYPNRTFKGKVNKVRLDAQMTQNVVTYTVVIDADNSDGKLLPYLTANVSFQVAKHDNVLMVPNAALRWSPSSPDMVSPEVRDQEGGGTGGGRGARGGGGAADASGSGGGGGGRSARAGGGEQANAGGAQTEGSGSGPAGPGAPTGGPTTRRARGGGNGNGGGGGGATASHHGTVWIAEGKYVKPVRVRTGLTDGINTEVQSDEIKEGTEVVTAEGRPEVSTDDARNPFAPNFRGGRGGRGGGGGRGR